jgi:hypothetical protein
MRCVLGAGRCLFRTGRPRMQTAGRVKITGAVEIRSFIPQILRRLSNLPVRLHPKRDQMAIAQNS